MNISGLTSLESEFVARAVDEAVDKYPDSVGIGLIICKKAAEEVFQRNPKIPIIALVRQAFFALTSERENGFLFAMKKRNKQITDVEKTKQFLRENIAKRINDLFKKTFSGELSPQFNEYAEKRSIVAKLPELEGLI